MGENLNRLGNFAERSGYQLTAFQLIQFYLSCLFFAVPSLKIIQFLEDF